MDRGKKEDVRWKKGDFASCRLKPDYLLRLDCGESWKEMLEAFMQCSYRQKMQHDSCVMISKILKSSIFIFMQYLQDK